MHITGVIPARYSSTRFPGKPLAKILGKTMIRRVWEQARQSKLLNDIIIATDDKRIMREAEIIGARAVLTGKAVCGTDRIRKVAATLNSGIIINIQGDEPLISASHIDRLAEGLVKSRNGMATLAGEITRKEYLSKNVIKVVSDKNGNALYFSRSPIPYGSSACACKHIGIYAYRRKILLESRRFQSRLADSEDLEQLRFLENGVKIRVIMVKYPGIAVDRPGDIKKVEKVLKCRKK